MTKKEMIDFVTNLKIRIENGDFNINKIKMEIELILEKDKNDKKIKAIKNKKVRNECFYIKNL